MVWGGIFRAVCSLAACPGNKAMNASSMVVALVCALIARGQHAASIHGDKPVEPFGLLHIGGRDKDTHVAAPRADAFDQLPELSAREKVNAGDRLIENQEVRIVNKRAT